MLIVLTIRKEQMRLLRTGRGDLHTFIAAHLRDHFPEQTRALDDQNLAGLIERGERKAWGLGIQDGPGICKLVDLMVVFGEDFDTNPMNRWFVGLLLNPSAGTPAERIDAAARLAAGIP